MNIIRKIAIGPDYKQAMTYQVGQPVLNGYAIHDIKRKPNGEVDIYINNDVEVVQWKSFSPTIPMAIEYKIDF